MFKIPTLEELMKAGVHFGHQKSKWHPKMAPYIFTEKNKVHIINLEKTQEMLVPALNFIKDTVAAGGMILFLGTKKQAQAAIAEAAKRCGMPYITARWLGGTFTNSKSVLGLIKNYKRLKLERETGKWERYTKREKLKLGRKVEKLEPIVGGMEMMSKLPEAIFIIDIHNEKTAVLESNKVHIPVIATCDTNVNPTRVDYVIPSNDDAVKAIEIMANLAADAVLAGKEAVKEASPAVKPVEKPVAAPVQKVKPVEKALTK